MGRKVIDMSKVYPDQPKSWGKKRCMHAFAYDDKTYCNVLCREKAQKGAKNSLVLCVFARDGKGKCPFGKPQFA